MRQSFKSNTVQGFAVDAIATNVTTLDLADVEAIRLQEDAAYTATFKESGDNGSSVMPEGVTVIGDRMLTLVFDAPVTVEIMRA